MADERWAAVGKVKNKEKDARVAAGQIVNFCVSAFHRHRLSTNFHFSDSHKNDFIVL